MDQAEAEKLIRDWKTACSDAAHWAVQARIMQANLAKAERREEALRAQIDALAEPVSDELVRRVDLKQAADAFRERCKEYAADPCQATLDAMNAARRAVEALKRE